MVQPVDEYNQPARSKSQQGDRTVVRSQDTPGPKIVALILNGQRHALLTRQRLVHGLPCIPLVSRLKCNLTLPSLSVLLRKITVHRYVTSLYMHANHLEM